MDTICSKLYTKVITLAADLQSGVVELRDTAGSSIPCNYLKVLQNRSIAQVGYVYIQPSGVYFLQGLQFDPSACTTNGSGCGGFAVGPNESYEYISPSRFSAIGYKYNQSGGASAGTTQLVITYGVVAGLNTLKGFGSQGR